MPSYPTCLSNRMVLEEAISRLMDDGNTVYVAYSIFIIFDFVNRRFFLAKPELFGLFDKVVRWIKSLLV